MFNLPDSPSTEFNYATALYRVLTSLNLLDTEFSTVNYKAIRSKRNIVIYKDDSILCNLRLTHESRVKYIDFEGRKLSGPEKASQHHEFVKDIFLELRNFNVDGIEMGALFDNGHNYILFRGDLYRDYDIFKSEGTELKFNKVGSVTRKEGF